MTRAVTIHDVRHIYRALENYLAQIFPDGAALSWTLDDGTRESIPLHDFHGAVEAAVVERDDAQRVLASKGVYDMRPELNRLAASLIEAKTAPCTTTKQVIRDRDGRIAEIVERVERAESYGA